MTQESFFVVVGLGLMGGSYAMGLAKNGYRVGGIDRDEATIEYALQNNIISEGAAGKAPAEELLRRADHLILALYPADILAWLRENLSFLKPGILITDLAGVKACFVPEAQALLSPGQEFIPSHPMAGKEHSGIQNADDAIFKGANFLITPTPRNTPAGIAFVRKLAETLRFGSITELTVEAHDRMIGYVSQLTHAIAVSLMNANDDPLLPRVTGDSFRDLTRIADINGELWSELFLANSGMLTEEIDLFVATLSKLRSKIAAGDKEGLKKLFALSTRRRREFDKP